MAKTKKRKIIINILIAIATVVAVAIIAVVIWLCIPLKGVGVDDALTSSDTVTVVVNKHYLAMVPEEEITTGIILYQGAKVDYKAYAPLARAFADKGYFCAVIDSTFNVAILDDDTAEDIMEAYPNITSWYVGGHSLGGVVASNLIEEQPDTFDGLILLASFTDKDISDVDINVISVYGSNDKVLDMDSYIESRSKLPRIAEMAIEGGNHAQFGNYGKQWGDGTATISAEEQQRMTVEYIIEMIETL